MWLILVLFFCFSLLITLLLGMVFFVKKFTCKMGVRVADQPHKGKYIKAEKLNTKYPDLYTGLRDVAADGFKVCSIFLLIAICF